jgi:hypothetical protein
MSLTVRDVIKRANRLMGALATGDDPTADELNDALISYNSMVRSMFGTVLGPRLSSLTAALSITAEPGGLYQVGSAAVTITLPAQPRSGARVGVNDANLGLSSNVCTVNRNGRLLEGAAANLTLNTNGTSRVWFYRGDTGNWVREADALIDDIPYFPDPLIAYLPDMLAVYVSGEYGSDIRPDTVAKALEGRQAFARTYSRRGRNQADAPVGVLPVQGAVGGSNS